ncbi:hypothetical protein D3C81_1273600 [compost metagenome]
MPFTCKSDRHRKPIQLGAPSGVIAEMLRRVTHVGVFHDAVWRTFIKHFKLSQLLRVFVYQVSNTPQHLASFRTRQLAPSTTIERFSSSQDCLLDVFLVGVGDFRNDLPSCGVIHFPSLTASRFKPLTIDEKTMGATQEARGLC